MCFKSLHTVSAKKMDLFSKDSIQIFQSTIFVFCTQMILLGMIFVVLGEIVSPPVVSTLGARFVCCFLMHLQVEADMR